MSDCDHLTHPEHWPGDCGDLDTITASYQFGGPTTFEDIRTPPAFEAWLRTLGAIQ